MVAVWLGTVLSFGLLGAGWATLRSARVRASPLAALARHLVRVDGVLLTDPQDGPLGWTASVRTDRVQPIVFTSAGTFVVHDPLWVEAHGRAPRFEAGDRLMLSGTLELPQGSFGEYLVHRGYPASLLVDSVRRTGGPSSPVMHAAGAVRSALRASVERVFRPREAGLLMGLALGDTSRLDPHVEEDFRATGLSHLTAVSGENVAMFLAPILGLATMLRLGRRGRLAVGLGAIGFFVLLTRAEPSVLRAAAMSAWPCWGSFWGVPAAPRPSWARRC